MWAKRPTYSDFFKIANKKTSDDTINVLINTDIVIGEGLDKVVLTPKQIMCVTRHDVASDGKSSVNVGGGSHDGWIWVGHIDDGLGKFYMGKFLCDGVLAGQFNKAGYSLKNPVRGLKLYHIHLSGIRTYTITTTDKVLGFRNGVKFSDNDNVFTETDVYYDGYSDW
jgi:hypothetical protein